MAHLQSEPVSSKSSQPQSLPDILKRHNLLHLQPRLAENGVITLSTFNELHPNELSILCDSSHLSADDKLKIVELHQTLNHSVSANQSKDDNKLLDEVQHFLGSYFTEIEQSCQTATAEIDAKFQEIQSLITSKQQAFHQKIDLWKLDQLDRVNQEISDITKSRTASNARSPSNSKYGDSSKLTQHIEEITPLMTVQFGSEFADRIQSAIDSAVQLSPKKSISFPSISFSKPDQFTDKNDGYSVRLNWTIGNMNDSNRINKDRITLKYKMADKLNGNDDDEKEREFTSGNPRNPRNGQNEWRVFRHGVIGETKEDDGNLSMHCQSLDVLRPNQQYFCQIEYAIKKPMDFVISSNIESFVNVKREELNENGDIDVVAIKLQYHSHRKHSLTRHPKYLLMNSDTKQYWSAFNSDFQREERDWMVFRLKENRKWVPTQIMFKNYKSNQDVKRMRVYIGDIRTKKWQSLTKEEIAPLLSKDMQYFNVDCSYIENDDDEEMRFVKVEFIENYGENNPDMCRFCCRHFKLMGYPK